MGKIFKRLFTLGSIFFLFFASNILPVDVRYGDEVHLMVQWEEGKAAYVKRIDMTYPTTGNWFRVTDQITQANLTTALDEAETFIVTNGQRLTTTSTLAGSTDFALKIKSLNQYIGLTDDGAGQNLNNRYKAQNIRDFSSICLFKFDSKGTNETVPYNFYGYIRSSGYTFGTTPLYFWLNGQGLQFRDSKTTIQFVPALKSPTILIPPTLKDTLKKSFYDKLASITSSMDTQAQQTILNTIKTENILSLTDAQKNALNINVYSTNNTTLTNLFTTYTDANFATVLNDIKTKTAPTSTIPIDTKKLIAQVLASKLDAISDANIDLLADPKIGFTTAQITNAKSGKTLKNSIENLTKENFGTVYTNLKTFLAL